MARMSRADQVIIEETQRLIRRIQARAGVDKSIKQVLDAEPVLLGQTQMAVRLFLELDHLSIEDPVLVDFIQNATT